MGIDHVHSFNGVLLPDMFLNIYLIGEIVSKLSCHSLL